MRADGVRLSLWRALVAFRATALLVALALIVRWQPIYARPGVALAVGAAMIVVTAAVSVLALSGRAHRPSVVLADVVVTAGLTLLTPVAQTSQQYHGDMVTLTTIWAAGPTIEAAFVGGAFAGLGAGLLQYVLSALIADNFSGRTLYSGVLLVVTGGVAGLVARYSVRAEDELRIATAAQAAVAEREKLARSIHDGVLQVLGLVHRTGREADEPWRTLAAAAAEQEIALRSLITSRPIAVPQTGHRDLADALRTLGAERVTVSAPAEPVLLPTAITGELTDAVRAALANVETHAGPDAKAWVLLEAWDAQVCVTVRDDGVGIAHGRLDAAAEDGRIGVARSIRGRIDELGGRCTVNSAPGEGTEIEMVVPVPTS